MIGPGLYCGGPVMAYCDNVELGDHVCFNGATLDVDIFALVAIFIRAEGS